MKVCILLFCCMLGVQVVCAQPEETINEIEQAYPAYREASLTHRRFKHADILPLVQRLQQAAAVEVRELGTSIEGRAIYQIRVGSGPVKVLLWSQMHGDESTATMALFDLLNFFTAEDEFTAWKKEVLTKVSVYLIPMLNPDGAQRFTRRNRLGVDLNRDALRLQSPEARILKAARDRLQADFGFNLHDQGRVYAAGRSPQSATISVLAPAYNYEKDVNEVRANAMKLIALMNRRLQGLIPGRVGRYNDDFEPRAFGDNIQKWGTSTILIESGGAPGDREKQTIRKVNFVAILTGIHAIANGLYEDEQLEEYERIPFNERLLFDLLIRQATIELLDREYLVDIAINQWEVNDSSPQGFHFNGQVVEWGDLSPFYGYEEIDASGMTAEAGKLYPRRLKNAKALYKLDAQQLIQQGYTHIRMKKLPDPLPDTPFVLLDKQARYQPELRLGSAAHLLLKRNGEVVKVIKNGFVVWEKE
ncbi:MAG: peptidase M14 [Bacteroidetes bacterium]|nr:MAG: peptidase M14 [Bacteroidota bacterium]